MLHLRNSPLSQTPPKNLQFVAGIVKGADPSLDVKTSPAKGMVHYLGNKRPGDHVSNGYRDVWKISPLSQLSMDGGGNSTKRTSQTQFHAGVLALILESQPFSFYSQPLPCRCAPGVGQGRRGAERSRCRRPIPNGYVNCRPLAHLFFHSFLRLLLLWRPGRDGADCAAAHGGGGQWRKSAAAAAVALAVATVAVIAVGDGTHAQQLQLLILRLPSRNFGFFLRLR